jgi:DNA-binding SARP family transcriptional activator
MLALRANRVVSVDQLIDVVWGDDPPASSRGQVQTSISALRKLLGDAGLPEAIKTRPSGYVLEVAEEDLDSAQFNALVGTAHRQAADGHPDTAAETLNSALNLWRGPALDGVHSDLVRNAAAVLEEARLTAAEERMRLELELGRHGSITGELRALLAEHPWRERLYSFLMLALYRSGRQAEALEVYRQARTVLATEVGIEPGQELRDLERAVLSSDPSLDLPAAEPEVDDEASEKLSAIPRQLPSSIADFIGREEHITDIVRFLTGRVSPAARYAVPVVAISGRGGVGKSTLALRVAHELGTAFPDGHMYVDLQGPNGDESPLALLARFLRALGVRGSVIPDRLDERIEMYRSRLADKRLLLVLDDATSEEQVLTLLPGSPSCAVIVTSRTRLVALPGAHWIDVDIFDDDTSVEFLARIVGTDRLLAERKAAGDVARYCGGLPLALRIAGARLASRPHWPIGELARRLKNEVRRLDELSHQGMAIRSNIGLTYRSLPDRAKRLFRLVSMVKIPDFPGWIAAALVNTGLYEAEDLLDRLVEAQMLDALRGQDGTIRYRLHDLIRVYAQERLTETETDGERQAAMARMLSAWLALAEMAHRKEYGGDYTILHGTAPRVHLPEWADEDPIGSPMEWLENERMGLVVAIRQAAAANLDELCWDLALTSVSLFEVRGYLDDWRETAEIAHDSAVRAGNHTGMAAMLYSLGSLHLFQKQLDESEKEFAESLSLFECDGNVHGQALVMRSAALLDRWQGRFDLMLAKYEDALAGMRGVGDLIGQASILTSMAKFHLDEGDVDTAKALLSEALELCQRTNYRRGEAHVMSQLAELYLRTRQVALSRRALNDVLRTVREIGDRVGEAYALYGIGLVRRDEGQLDSAEATLAHALTIGERIGDRLIAGQACYALGEMAIVRVDNATAARYLERARAMFTELRSALWLAKTYLLLSEVHAAAGESDCVDQDLDRACELLSKIDSKQSIQLMEQLRRRRSAHLAGDISG